MKMLERFETKAKVKTSNLDFSFKDGTVKSRNVDHVITDFTLILCRLQLFQLTLSDQSSVKA